MKCKYRVRWFSSKGAFLVLLWTLLLVISCSLLVQTARYPSVPTDWLFAIPVTFAFVSAPLSGWLADGKFGNYKVFRVGVVLLFFSAVINCLFLILEALVWSNNNVFKIIHLCMASTLFAIGIGACTATALPLGLDQMPDASSSSITSFIAWFVCAILFGSFLYRVLYLVNENSLVESLALLSALFSVLCLSIVLILFFVFSPKWLIIEPKSPQSLKTIYHVLKFAAKHKAPLNRSAFTYWEENIPSRMDLGKLKYGGPFTTEQVEDVKTILRFLVLSAPLFLVALSSDSHMYEFNLYNALEYNFAYKFFLNTSSVYGIITTLLFEFLVYPLAKNKLPSILKRITAVSLILTLVSFVCLILELSHYLSNSNETTTKWIADIFHVSMNGILLQMLLTSLLEFMCAQSPYNMRGLLISFILPFLFFSSQVDLRVAKVISHKLCFKKRWCSIVAYSVKTLTSFVGSLIFCVVAHWYKMRVRDEDFSTQRVVEEVYDRYLTAAATHSRLYGTLDNRT